MRTVSVRQANNASRALSPVLSLLSFYALRRLKLSGPLLLKVRVC